MDSAPWLATGATQGRWVDAGDLHVGDAVRQADGATGLVQAVVVVERSQPMYNLTVAVAHTFFVGDGAWLVHNCGGTQSPKWPQTAKEMDELLGFKGDRIPDSPLTPGRDKVTWKPSDRVKITYEQHPYHPNAPQWHKGPHWHLDTPQQLHTRHLPGDDIPGF